MKKNVFKIAFLCAVSLAGKAFSDQVAVASFKGINNNENSAIINPSEAQDLLNIDFTAGGKSFKKRPGYGLYKTLATTQGLHGGFHFFDSSGNDVSVWGSSTSLYGIVADAAPTQLISSATLNATWDCADVQGSAYCVTSSRDAYIKTNGATLQSWATSPLGTIIEATPDRIAVAGVSGSASSIYHSGSNAFTNFTAGPLTTDPFIEPIAAPGSKITHLRWACGKLLWWKDQSFGYEAFEDQYALQIKIISDNIGTFDNTSAIDPGGSVWFRGQDGHIWQYNCSGLIKQSIEITPLVQASGRRTSNSFTQTSQSDFQAGSSSPTNPSQPLNFTISAGDVVPGSYTVTENSSASGWGSGTTSNVTVGASSITLSTNNSGNVTDQSFEAASLSTNWTTTVTQDTPSSVASVTSSNCGTINPQSGSRVAKFDQSYSGSESLVAQTVSVDALTLYDQVTIPFSNNDCSYTQRTLTTSASNLGKRFRLKFKLSATGDNFISKDSYILGGNITFYTASDKSGTSPQWAIDNVQSGSSTISSGFFNSRSIDTNLPFSYVYSSATWSINASTPSFLLQKATATTGPWTDITTSTNSNSQVNGRYLRYVSTITVTSADSFSSAITGVNLIAMSSGTYFSAWKNAASLAAWSTFNPTYTNGDGSHAFFVRSSTSPQAVLNSTVAWVVQTDNALVAASTGTYFQVIDSFTITSATGTPPALNAFTVNWYEGSATDQAYMLYFDNSIWADVAYGVGVSSNTYIFKRDLINDLWTIYNFGAGGLLVQNAHLFFGDVASTGKIFQYDSGHSDNGSTINAYWKSKDFTGTDPFLKSSLTQIDTFLKKDQGSTLTATYTLDTSTTTTSYSILLSSSTQSVIQNRKQLPSGKDGYTFSLQYGDTSASSNWEIFGFRIGLTQNPYRPSQ